MWHSAPSFDGCRTMDPLCALRLLCLSVSDCRGRSSSPSWDYADRDLGSQCGAEMARRWRSVVERSGRRLSVVTQDFPVDAILTSSKSCRTVVHRTFNVGFRVQQVLVAQCAGLLNLSSAGLSAKSSVQTLSCVLVRDALWPVSFSVA